MLLLIFMRYL